MTRITDEAVKVMAEYLAEAHSGRLWDQYTAATRELLIENYLPTAHVALRSALPHLEGATPTLGEIKSAIRTGLGGDTEDEACGCESHICSAAGAVLALIGGAA